MAKKKISSTKNNKYKSFKLHGKYQSQTVILYAVTDLIISLVIGFILQSQVAQAFALQ